MNTLSPGFVVGAVGGGAPSVVTQRGVRVATAAPRSEEGRGSSGLLSSAW